MKSQVSVDLKIEVAGTPGLIWDMPTGIADVWRLAPRSILLTYSDLARFDDAALESLATLPQAYPSRLGSIRITTGWLVVMWAADSGSEIGDVEPAPAQPFDLSVGHSAIVIDVPPGLYGLYSDEVGGDAGQARRAFVMSETESTTASVGGAS